jgi:parvulin-like peptidyl-prolyl isomerase
LSRPRTLRGVLAIGAASLVLAACSSAPTGPVATVDGFEVPRERLEGWVRTATDANDQVDPVGLQADLLSRVVQQRIIDGLLAERGLTVDPALLEEIREAITAQVGGALALEATLIDIGFPRDYFDDVFLAVEASIDTLILSLADGRTLETRTARHILVETAEEADEIFALLQGGADFAELAIERSTDPGSGSRGGDLGPQQRGAFVPPFDAAVWSGRVGRVIAPVESDFGFHVIEVTAIQTTPASELSSQERRGLVGADLETLITAAFRAAAVTIDPTIGVWDPLTGSITPAS